MRKPNPVSLSPEDATSSDDFVLEEAIRRGIRDGNTPAANPDEVKGLMVHRCSPALRWSVGYLAERLSKTQSGVVQAALHKGVTKLLEQPFVSRIEKAAAQVFALSVDPEDRGWFEAGYFSLDIAGERSYHTYANRHDIELCGRLGSILGLKAYVVRQLALAAGLLFSSTLPRHHMASFGVQVEKFLEWGQQRAVKAERELRRVEAETASKSCLSSAGKDWREIFDR